MWLWRIWYAVWRKWKSPNAGDANGCATSKFTKVDNTLYLLQTVQNSRLKYVLVFITLTLNGEVLS